MSGIRCFLYLCLPDSLVEVFHLNDQQAPREVQEEPVYHPDDLLLTRDIVFNRKGVTPTGIVRTGKGVPWYSFNLSAVMCLMVTLARGGGGRQRRPCTTPASGYRPI